MARGRASRAGAAVLALALTAASIATAVTVQQGNLRITVQSLISPYKLPRHKPAPIAVFVSGHPSSSPSR